MADIQRQRKSQVLVPGLRPWMDLHEGSSGVLVRAELRHQCRLCHVQAVRPTMPEMQDRQVRARYVVPRGGCQGYRKCLQPGWTDLLRIRAPTSPN